MGKLPAVLGELRQIVITPFKKYIPSAPLSQSEVVPVNSTVGVSGSVGVIGDPPDPDDLPSQIVRVIGKGTPYNSHYLIVCFKIAIISFVFQKDSILLCICHIKGIVATYQNSFFVTLGILRKVSIEQVLYCNVMHVLAFCCITIL